MALLFFYNIYYKLMGKINTSPPPASLLIPTPEQHLTNLVELVISAILFKHDLTKINFDENYGEYNLEAKRISNKLTDCENVNNLKIIIDNVFSQSFGIDWGQFISSNHKSLHLGFMAREIWTMNEVLFK